MRQRREPINWRNLACAALWDIAWLVIVVGLIAAIVGTATAATLLDVSVIVKTQLADGSIAGGSGTIVDSRGGYSLILSCGHVFRGAASNAVSVTLSDGRVLAGTLQRRSEEPDLAAVSVPVELPVIAPLATSDPQKQEPTNTVGLLKVKAGPVQLVANYSRVFSIIVGRQSVDGDSGGGVFNSRGELIGVHWGGSNGEAFAVGVAQISEFLAALGIRETGCRWTRDPCGNWIKVCDQRPPSFVPPSQPQQPVRPSVPPPAITLPPAQPADNRVSEVESQITTINQQITNLQATVNAAKPCECGQCCDKLREEFNAKLETLAANQVQITNEIKQQQPATPNYDAIAAEVAKRLPSIHMRVTPEAAYQTVKLGSYVTLPLDKQNP